MTAKIIFALSHYGMLALFAFSAYGLGRPVLGQADSTDISPSIITTLRLAAGIGMFMAALFLAGIVGFFQPFTILFIIVMGWWLAITSLLKKASHLSHQDSTLLQIREIAGRAKKYWIWILLVVAACLPLALRPLQPPMQWDEVMYHLPYAQFWADQGRLSVDPWVRYPLSAYNLNLLYSAALSIAGDVFPHLIHAGMAVLTAIIVFTMARSYMDWRVGLIAVIALLHATRWEFSNAYVDLGVMLFWSCAFAALALRHKTGSRRFSYLAAFFAGIAVGVKYQALFYLPAFVFIALIVERHTLTIARSILILILSGGYWYLRNAFISGDPLHPIGASFFGFWLWSAEDLALQYNDLERVRAWPDWYLVIGVGAVFFLRNSQFFLRGLFLAASIGFGVWLLASGYPRYLTPIYPLLALLSASVALWIWQRAQPFLLSIWDKFHPAFRFLLITISLLFASAMLFNDTIKFWSRIHPEPKERAEYLSQKMPGYKILQTIEDKSNQVIYQFGFENEIYYLGKFSKSSVRGDHFGPGRYSDVIQRANNAYFLAQHLRSLGVNTFLINKAREPFASTHWDPAFFDHFDLLASSEKAAIYRLRNINY